MRGFAQGACCTIGYRCFIHVTAAMTHEYTVQLSKRKLFISGSCPILVLTTVVGLSRHADAEKSV